MKTLCSFRLQWTHDQVIYLPRDAAVIGAGLSPAGDPYVWALLEDPDARLPEQGRCILMAHVGDLVPVTGHYLATVTHSERLWHVFACAPT